MLFCSNKCLPCRACVCFTNSSKKKNCIVCHLFSETPLWLWLQRHIWDHQRRLCEPAAVETTEPEERKGDVLIWYFSCIWNKPLMLKDNMRISLCAPPQILTNHFSSISLLTYFKIGSFHPLYLLWFIHWFQITVIQILNT